MNLIKLGLAEVLLLGLYDLFEADYVYALIPRARFAHHGANNMAPLRGTTNGSGEITLHMPYDLFEADSFYIMKTPGTLCAPRG